MVKDWLINNHFLNYGFNGQQRSIRMMSMTLANDGDNGHIMMPMIKTCSWLPKLLILTSSQMWKFGSMKRRSQVPNTSRIIANPKCRKVEAAIIFCSKVICESHANAKARPHPSKPPDQEEQGSSCQNQEMINHMI